jgi:hypothetical protein
MFPGDSMSQMAFMQNSMNMNMAMASPVMSRNALQMGGMAGFSPAMSMSPQLGLSPGMGMMMTPDMQLSAQQMQLQSLSDQMNRMPMSQMIPPPPMGPPSLNNTPQQQMRNQLTPQQQIRNQLTPQQQIRNQLTPQQQTRHQLTPQQQMAKHIGQQQHQQQQMSSQQQQQMMMNAGGMGGGMGGGNGANFMGGGDMMSPQQQQQAVMMNSNCNMMNNNSMMNARQQQQLRNNNVMNPHMQQQQQSSGMMGSQQQQLRQQQQPQHQSKPQHLLNNGRINEQEQQQLNAQQLKQLKEEQQIFGQQQRQSTNEMQMLQSKLAAIYSPDSFDPRPLAENMTSHSSAVGVSDGISLGYDFKTGSGGEHVAQQIRQPPNRSSSGGGGVVARNVNSNISSNNSNQGDDQPSRVDVPSGNSNARRIPPASLKRENSLKMEKIFEPLSPTAADHPEKKTYTGNHSSAHISAMSLSMGDLNDEGNLSQVFDSSLRISTSTGMSHNMKDTTVHQSNRSKSGVATSASKMSSGGKGASDDTTNRSDRTPFDHGFDMSVATIGMSDAGNMSYATFGDGPDGPDDGPDNSEDVMSFSKVFDDSNKLG